MKFDLHPACAAWPEMNPKELGDLAKISQLTACTTRSR